MKKKINKLLTRKNITYPHKIKHINIKQKKNYEKKPLH